MNYSDFENFEIAFLYKYRYDEFLKNTKSEINKEIERRHLTKEKIENLIKKKLTSNNESDKNKKICPRCKSYKLVLFEKEKDYYGATIFDFVDQDKDPPKEKFLKCIVCGFDLRKKYREESFKTKMLKFLGIKKMLPGSVQKSVSKFFEHSRLYPLFV